MNRSTARAPYMHWAKSHAKAPHDLTGSNLQPVTLDELPGARDVIDLHGPNEEGYDPLVTSIAARYGVTRDRVCTATGTSGANFLVMAAVLRAGDEVLIEHPAYDPILGIAEMLGARVTRSHRRFESAFQPDPDEISRALTDDTRLVVLTNLHNPTGALIPTDTLLEIGRHAERVGARVHVDEVYLETAFEHATQPAATLGNTFVSTNSLTKTWGLSGLRTGWILAAPDVAESVRRARDVVDAVGSFPSDTIATLAFSEMDRLLERSQSILLRNSAKLREAMNDAADEAIIAWVEPPAGASIAFPRLLGSDDAAPFVDWMLAERGVGVVPGHFFDMPEHFRIAVGGDPTLTDRAVDQLSEALRDWASR